MDWDCEEWEDGGMLGFLAGGDVNEDDVLDRYQDAVDRVIDMVVVAVLLDEGYTFLHGIGSKELSDEYDKDTIQPIKYVLGRGSEWLTLKMCPRRQNTDKFLAVGSG